MSRGLCQTVTRCTRPSRFTLPKPATACVKLPRALSSRNDLQATMSKTVGVVVILAVLCAATVLRADARTLTAAAYAPYNAEEEKTETPAYKAEEAYSGKGLFPGEAYAPNVPALVEGAATAPAPLGAALIKLANQVAPAGAPQVGATIEQEKSKKSAEAPTKAENLDKAKEKATSLKAEARPALAPEDKALSPGNNPGA